MKLLEKRFAISCKGREVILTIFFARFHVIIFADIPAEKSAYSLLELDKIFPRNIFRRVREFDSSAVPGRSLMSNFR